MHERCRVPAFIPYLDLSTYRIFRHPVQNWTSNSLFGDNSSGAYWNHFLRLVGSTDQRMCFKMDNLFVVNQYFTFGFFTVPPGVGHVFQTSAAPMLVFHFNEQRALDTLKDIYMPKPSTMRRSLVERDEYFYDRYVLRPRSTYVVPPGINYLILRVQKTLFAVDVLDFKTVREFTDFRTHSSYKLDEYDVPPPSPKGPKMTTPKDRIGQAPAKRQKTV